MEGVQRYLAQLLQTQRYGGRIMVRDESTIIVYDTPNWGEREFSAMRARFPDCEVSVQAYDSSLSGFAVIITRKVEPWAVVTESSFVLSMLGVFWTAWFLYGYLRGQAAVPVVG